MDKLSQKEIGIQFKEFEQEIEEGREVKWEIKDEGTALWAANRIAQMKFSIDYNTASLKEQKEDWKRRMEVRLDTYDEKIKAVEDKYKPSIDFFSYHIQKWCLEQKKKDKKYSFMHPEIKVKFNTPQAKLIYDEAVILKWAKENKMEELLNIKHEESIRKDEFKKRIEEVEILDEDGGVKVVFTSKDTGEELEVTKETFEMVAKVI